MAALTSTSRFDHELEVAVAAARAAADLIRTRRPTQTRYKRPNDIVTDVDLAAERVIAEVLIAEYPADALLAEEGGPSPGQTDRLWCIDPLDGTANFAAGIPHFAVAVALVVNDRPVVAVTHDVTRNEVYTAIVDGGFKINGRDACPRSTGHVEDSLVALQLPEPTWRSNERLVDAVNQSRGVRVSGSMALDFAWTAAGLLDACLYRQSSSPWDWIGGELLVARAGGDVLSIGDLDGLPLMVAGSVGAVAALRSSLSRRPGQ